MKIKYIGTNFHGWQRQLNAISIQQVIEETVERIYQQKITVFGAGRTDAGVHAFSQVAHYQTEIIRPIPKLLRGLNALLPDDISITELKHVEDNFHARYDAKEKTYAYNIWNNPIDNPFLKPYCLTINNPLLLDNMNKAASNLIGIHDFSSFCAASSETKTKIRTIFSASLQKISSDLIIFTITGNGFLQHMVRIIMGTLIEIGMNKRKDTNIKELLKEKNREKAGPTAPAKGLTLIKIKY